ncbi:hypothetical protein [Ensifer sp. R-19]|uniref:hypothetical protein n=1 Tax=Ensifer sp. R-19 TaxID=3404055 RepID=UPI003CF4C7CF
MTGAISVVDGISLEMAVALRKRNYRIVNLLSLVTDECELSSVLAIPIPREDECYRILPDKRDLEEIEAGIEAKSAVFH